MNRATVLILPALLAAPAASAQDFRVGGELGLYHEGRSDVTALTEVIDADITLVDSIAIVGGIPFVQLFGSEDGNTEARFRIGNPYAAAYYQSKGSVATFRIGAGFAIPAAQLPNDQGGPTALIMYSIADVMGGLLTPWLWAPETVPIMLPSLRLALDLGFLSLEAAGDVVILVPLSDDLIDSVEVAIPLAAGAMVHIGFLGLGARLGFAFFPTAGDDRDKAQVSLSPRITADFGPLELEARLTMNLDGPNGFAFDEGRVWAFFLGAHVAF